MIMDYPIIAIYSLAPQSGKTALAIRIARQCHFLRIAFADPIKRMALEAISSFGVRYTQAIRYVYDNKEAVIPNLGVTARYLLQTLGTEWGRNLIHEDVWVRAMEERFREIRRTTGQSIVIDDMRFRNEAEWVVRMGGLTVRIDRDSAMQSYRGAHASEGALAEFKPHLILANNSTLDDLWEGFIHGVQRLQGTGFYTGDY